MSTAAAWKPQEKRLLAMRKSLLEEITDGMKEGADETKKDIGDLYDLASSERERELNLILGHRDREKLAQIDEALSRITEGTYGVCEECGGKIGAERMKVMPFARMCIDCKAELERTTMMSPDLDAGRSYREGGMNDGDDEE
jgi:DnaK suppressor protein